MDRFGIGPSRCAPCYFQTSDYRRVRVRSPRMKSRSWKHLYDRLGLPHLCAEPLHARHLTSQRQSWGHSGDYSSTGLSTLSTCINRPSRPTLLSDMPQLLTQHVSFPPDHFSCYRIAHDIPSQLNITPPPVRLCFLCARTRAYMLTLTVTVRRAWPIEGN